jgi:hypothetical protein
MKETIGSAGVIGTARHFGSQGGIQKNEES